MTFLSYRADKRAVTLGPRGNSVEGSVWCLLGGAAATLLQGSGAPPVRVPGRPAGGALLEQEIGLSPRTPVVEGACRSPPSP